MNKILVFRNGHIGNTLVAQGFFRTLKELYPNSELHVVVDGIGKELLKYDPYIDKFFKFNKKKDSFLYQLNLIKQWKQEKYDVSFHLRAGSRNEQLAFLSRIPKRVGFPMKGTFQLLNIIVPRVENCHHYELGRILLSHFHTDLPDYLPKLYSNKIEENKVAKKFERLGIEKNKYVVIHPTGNTVKKDGWKLSFYSQIIDYITKELHLKCIIIGTNDEEKRLVQDGLNITSTPIYWYEDDIAEKVELIKQSSFFSGNDSGPFHIAESLDKHAFVLYRDLDANFQKWGPLNKDLTSYMYHSELENNTNAMEKVFNTFKSWVEK